MAPQRKGSTRPAVTAASTIAAAATALDSITATPLSPWQQDRRPATDRAIINNAEVRTNSQDILSIIRETRPKNTNSAYDPKQEEFRQFCRKKLYHDGDTVTEDKLLLFLVEEVTDRPLRAKSRKAADDIPHDETRLSWRSVRSYVTAVTDLYRAQKALGMNCHPSPREDNAREYIKSLQRRDVTREKSNFAGKGRDTLLDGYEEDELRNIASQLWAHTANSPECHFRTLIDMLLGHYMLSRGSERRDLEISDLSTFEFAGEGPTKCMPLIVTMKGTKKGQHGRLETAGALRSRNPLICMLGALAFYLLYRWDLSTEPFPDFTSRSQWHDIRLIKGTGASPLAALSYNSQRDWVVKAFEYAGISSNKKTHVGRSSGAKTAELKGVSEDQIRQAGRWNQDVIVGCYLNSLPRTLMRVMAGHPRQIGLFEIARANIPPPASLASLIWPQLDQWRETFGLGHGQTEDLAAASFINLLLYLREVILQDSAILKSQFPDNPIWDHPVFRHEDYVPYARQVAEAAREEERPSQLAVLTEASPKLADFLETVEGRQEARESRAASIITSLKAELHTVKSQLQLLESHTASIQTLLSSGSFQFIPRTPPLEQPPLAIPTMPAGRGGTSQQDEPGQYVIQSAASPTLASMQQVYNAESRPPIYHMCRAVKTVKDLWREWTVGLRGQPSIASLDSRWGSRWRAGRHSELQWYSLRLEIIKEVRRLTQARRITEETAMYIVATQQLQTNSSLDVLCKQLRASRKTRQAATSST